MIKIEQLTYQPSSIYEVEKQLDFWEKLAELRDTYGLPTDIIFIKLQTENRLPKNKQGQVMNVAEFRHGLQEAIQIRQAGGWRQIVARYSK